MKIKRLTAVLAVAAMAAGFTLASPMLSAQAAPALNSPADQMSDISLTVPGGVSTPIDIAAELANDPVNAGTNITWISDTIGTPATPFSTAYNNTMTNPTKTGGDWVAAWNCSNTTVKVIDPSTGLVARNLGTVSCDSSGHLIYYPSLALGANGPVDVDLQYVAIATFGPDAKAWSGFATATQPAIQGTIHLTVSGIANPSACAYSPVACISVDLQAYGKNDDATFAKVDVLTPNIYAAVSNPSGVLKASDVPAGWGLVAANNPISNDLSLSAPTMKTFLTYTPGRGANTVKFTAPMNWSGSITFDYIIAPYTLANGGADMSQQMLGSVTFVVHPTLADLDPITSDPGAKVTVPVLEQKIIGSKPFANAACTFADTKSKTTLAGTGTISNKGGSKDPIFTPDAAFTGSVDLVCTVQDKFGITSNSVTVTIQVGAPAPAPVAPTPACGDSCNGGKLVSTGGSLAAPMSSGLAAVVLLVAAGAGILVVRRRTALAG